MKSAYILYSFQSRQTRPNTDEKDLETLTPVIGLIGILFDSRTLLGSSEMWFLIGKRREVVPFQYPILTLAACDT